MLRKFSKCLKKKKLTMSADKTKIRGFEKGRGRVKRREWKEDREELEEVKEYLGYIMQKNGTTKRHIRERKAKATTAMNSAWSIGERVFKENYERRIKMFGALVESVGLYGAEVWGWKEENGLNGIRRKYTKWILGLDATTPNYRMNEECKIKEMGRKIIERTARYEEKSRKSGKILVKECIRGREQKWGAGKEGRWAV